jgi:hypothetical protein
MQIKCNGCSENIALDLKQKVVSDNCEAKVHFNIVEVICGCGNSNMVSISPKAIFVVDENRKMLDF